MIRSFDQNNSIKKVKYTSNPFRTHEDLGHRNTFLAVCWLMVLAPRFRLRVLFSFIAFLISTKSNPLCSAKRLSSEAITAIGRLGDILSKETHVCFHVGLSPEKIC